jgi:predicted acetyltransferase
MVNGYKEIKTETNYTPSEFFVMYKHRKIGVGTYVTKEIFGRFKRKWQL